MKKLATLMAVTAGLVVGVSGVAMANFGPHGGYVADTDGCAACHRAHTANGAMTWTDNAGADRSSLLLTADSNSTTLTDFCYTCHSGYAAGAATNVRMGTYTGTTGAETESEDGKVLNGGAFETIEGENVTSMHPMDTSADKIAYGSGDDVNPQIDNMGLTCTSCHDIHGSSNYRLLKDKVNGHVVGGYDNSDPNNADPDPTPFVVSAEKNFPNGADGRDLGFRLHKVYWPVSWSDNGPMTVPTAYDGTTPDAYKPNYTTARYAGPVEGDQAKGITGWCVACHEQYNTKKGVTAVDVPGDGTRTFGAMNEDGAYDAGDGAGAAVRHRHPMNVPLANFYINGNEADGPVGARALVYNPGVWQSTVSTAVKAVDIPLEHDASLGSQDLDATNSEVVSDDAGNSITVMTNSISDGIGCLTCHRAHGTAAQVNGYANVMNPFSADPTEAGPDTGIGGVPPCNNSGLLRADNRGVCERCHNK